MLRLTGEDMHEDDTETWGIYSSPVAGVAAQAAAVWPRNLWICARRRYGAVAARLSEVENPSKQICGQIVLKG